MANQPAQAFLSYAHADDDYLSGGITWLREELQRALRAITGEPSEIFQDVDGIAFGEHWPSRIEEALTGARFLIPMLTPSYFTSEGCREEAEFFLQHEKRHKRRDLVLPIYLIEADVLEGSASRAGDYLARQFYERQYDDWRDVAFNLRESPRIKQRAFKLAKQIKAASERIAEGAPPIVPAQGPGIRFGLNNEGKLDRAPDEPAEVTDDDPRLSSLQDGLQDACSRFLGTFEGGKKDNVSGAHSQLIGAVRAYQNAITGNLTELQYTDVYCRGLTLQNQMLARSRDVPRLDPPPLLEDEQEAAINDLLSLHDLLILSTKEGEDLQSRADQARLTFTERAKLWSPDLSDAAQASDHATERAKAILADVNEPGEDDDTPDRRALFALRTNRNFLTATGEAATGKNFSDLGGEALSEASRSARSFLLKNEKFINNLATPAQFGLGWLGNLIGWLKTPAGQKPPTAPTVVTEKFWTPGRIFRDIDEPWCPEMVVVPAGGFLMGSPEDEEGRFDNEGPRHHVIIKKPFALGRYPVTFEEYDFFCDQTGAKRPKDGGWGRGRRPVINVSWHDATAYCDWLSEQTQTRYRPPSEAEWEYACRAGTMTAYAFGKSIDKTQANFAGHVGQTIEVGSYPANGFKLSDMHGNVWEWCLDHYKSSYKYAPADGGPVLLAKGPEHVVRGGSWGSDARNARAAYRNAIVPGNRSNNLGFRCAGVQA